MKSVYSRIVSGAAAITMAVSALAADPSVTTNANHANEGFFGGRLAAKGKGIEVTLNEVEEAYIGFKATSAGQGHPIPESMRQTIERQITERLVHRQLLVRLANDEDKAKAKEDADTAYNNFRNRMSSEASFNRQLMAMGMTVESFKTKMLEETLSSAVVDRLLRPEVTITDEQVKQFYETNAAKFSEPAKWRISHILFLTQDMLQKELTEAQKKEKFELAGKVLKRIKAGEDFAALAREYSEDPNSRENGGELPPLSATQMAPELARTSADLAVNGVGEIVTSRVGYHIVKLNEKLPPKTTSLSEATKDIRELLTRQEVQKKLPDYLKKLREEAAVQFMDL
jgi:parvulin-like peptidyl-prolyl isomerase